MSKRLQILRKATKRKWFRRKGKKLLLSIDGQLMDRIDQLKKDMREFCGVKLTASYLFREGCSQLIRSLRLQMTKASKGKLHSAKRRKGLL